MSLAGFAASDDGSHHCRIGQRDKPWGARTEGRPSRLASSPAVAAHTRRSAHARRAPNDRTERRRSRLVGRARTAHPCPRCGLGLRPRSPREDSNDPEAALQLPSACSAAGAGVRPRCRSSSRHPRFSGLASTRMIRPDTTGRGGARRSESAGISSHTLPNHQGKSRSAAVSGGHTVDPSWRTNSQVKGHLCC